MRARAAFVVAALLAGAGAASAQQVLYKLIAKDGRITYSDHAPKNFDGKVVRLEPDTESNQMPFKRPTAVTPSTSGSSTYGADRTANREGLAKALRSAQDKVDAARKAKAQGDEPGPDEMQVIQQRFAPLKAGQSPPRSNCRNATDSQGRPIMLCAAQVPGEAYYDRQKKLEAELDKALEELADAERAYRRGAD